MILPFDYRTREDGVKLIRRLDVEVDENGEALLDGEKQPIPTGFKIRKVGTDELYDEAIDVENSGFTYEETNEAIDGWDEELSDAEFRELVEGAL
jgi:hypothetical protein